MLAVAVQTAPVKFQHTAARRRLRFWQCCKKRLMKFQHTAARRRLRDVRKQEIVQQVVSTHSRPKAAADNLILIEKED